MSDRIINLETAKLAKENGFNEYTKNIFLSNGLCVHTCHLDKNSDHQNEYCNDGFHVYTFLYSAPTQTVLQKWLRENHNIEIGVLRYSYSGGVYQGRCYMWFVDQYDDKYNYELEENEEYWILNERKSQGYKSKIYEEALEAALIVALKIVGNQPIESEYGNGNYGEGIRV